MEIILAGDIGGTNTRLALYEAGDFHQPQVMHFYPSGDFESLQSILSRFLEEAGGWLGGRHPDRAGFGAAGLVESEFVKPVNLPWVVELGM